MEVPKINETDAIVIDSDTGGSGKFALKPGLLESLKIVGRFTVTDAGISAGETLAGLIDKLRAVAPGMIDPIFEAQRDEVQHLTTLTVEGTNTGKYLDPVGSTGATVVASWQIGGGAALHIPEGTQLEIALRAVTDEFGAGSDFSVNFDIVANYVADADVVLEKIVRRKSASTTDPSFDMAEGKLLAAYYVVGSAGVLDSVRYPNGEVVEDEYSLHHIYTAWKDATPDASPTDYMDVLGFEVSNADRITMKLTSAATVTAYFAYLKD